MGIGYVQHTYLGLQPMGIPQIMENKKTNDMKNLKYILLAILLGINLVACEAPPINEEIGVEEVETISITEDEEEEVPQTSN